MKLERFDGSLYKKRSTLRKKCAPSSIERFKKIPCIEIIASRVRYAGLVARRSTGLEACANAAIEAENVFQIFQRARNSAEAEEVAFRLRELTVKIRGSGFKRGKAIHRSRH